MFTSASKVFSNAKMKNDVCDSTIEKKLYEEICSKSVSEFMDDFDYGDEYRLPDSSDCINENTFTPALSKSSEDEACPGTDTFATKGHHHQSGMATEQLDDSLEEQMVESESRGDELVGWHTGSRSPSTTLTAK